MRSWLAFLVALTACTDPVLESLSDIKSKVCACKTASCAQQEIKLVPQGPARSAPRAQEISRAMVECLAKLEAAEHPTADPDAEPAADEPAAPHAP